MDVLSRPAPPPDRTVRYGDEPDQVVDLRLPPPGAGPRPLVVVVHGGFWRAAYDRTHAGPQASALAATGYVVAVPEYRRVGQTGGGWPGTLDDTATWSDQVVDLAVGELGTDVVDRGRVVYVGHSAGGHLALWAAARHRLPESSPWRRAAPLAVRGVVSLSGVSDLRLAADLGLGSVATQDLLGGGPDDVPDRYEVCDPAGLVPTGRRAVLVHGVADSEVPVEVSRRFAARAQVAGDDVRLVELDRTGHYDLIDPLSDAWPAVVDAVAGVAFS